MPAALIQVRVYVYVETWSEEESGRKDEFLMKARELTDVRECWYSDRIRNGVY